MYILVLKVCFYVHTSIRSMFLCIPVLEACFYVYTSVRSVFLCILYIHLAKSKIVVMHAQSLPTLLFTVGAGRAPYTKELKQIEEEDQTSGNKGCMNDNTALSRSQHYLDLCWGGGGEGERIPVRRVTLR